MHDCNDSPCLHAMRRACRRARGGQRQLALFGAAYAVYNLARWLFAGDLHQACRHAHWIVGLEGTAGLAGERSVQHALDALSRSG